MSDTQIGYLLAGLLMLLFMGWGSQLVIKIDKKIDKMFFK